MAANIYLVDLADIRQMVFDELKLDPSDANEVVRINRDINAVYLDEVVPMKRWPWLSGHVSLQTTPFNSNGFASVTPGSTTVTLNVAPPTSVAGFKFATDQFDEVYAIATHTAGALTLTLDQPWQGALGSAVPYKIWTDTYQLPTDLRETEEVWHDFMKEPLNSVGLQDFRRRVSESPRSNGRPLIYCTTYDKLPETGSDRSRLIKFFPSVYQNATTIQIDYVKNALPLLSDGDEPLIPISDRVVLVYGALARAWRRVRNPEESANNTALYQQKLARMAGKLEDSSDRPMLSPDSEYLSRKRQRPNRGSMSGPFNAGGSYTAPTYLKNPVIEGAQLTANVTALSGVTVDGRDISVDGGNLDQHLSNTPARHLASQIQSSPAAPVTATDVQSAIGQLASGVASAATTAALNAHTSATAGVHGVTGTVVGTTDTQTLTNKSISGSTNTLSNVPYSALTLGGNVVNADINAAAAIALSKLAALASHNRVLVSDGSGLIAESAVTNTTLGYLDATSSIQTQLNGKQATGNYITALTGDVTASGPGSAASSIGAGKVTNTMLAGSIDLTTKVTGALPIANGGTGQVTANAAANALLPTQTSNSGKFLKTDGTNTSWANPTIALTAPTVQRFTTVGTGTYTTPAGVLYIKIRMVGGGGGGGPGGTSPGTSGGLASSSIWSVHGGAAILTAAGGAGGAWAGTGGPGGGGAVTVNSPAVSLVVLPGTQGATSGYTGTASAAVTGGTGGAGPLGGAGAAGGYAGLANTGAGGGGGSNPTGTGANGGCGGGSGGYIEAIISNPSALYDYQVGDKGSAGVGSGNGGPGGIGYIEVTEYYQ